MIPAHAITGVVLAGGRSRRMGVNKALLRLDGSTFLERVVAALRPVVDTLAISAPSDPAIPGLQLPVWPDLWPGQGPLGGLHAAMRHAATTHLLFAPCDCPGLTADMAGELATAAAPEEITVASDGVRLQPLFGVYPASVAAAIERRLRAAERGVQDFLDHAPVAVRIVARPAWRDRLRNINDPAAARHLGATFPGG